MIFCIVFMWVFFICITFYFKLSSLLLIFIIISIRFLLCFSFSLKSLSFLSFMWALVYLGGIIIVFVYVSFLRERNMIKKFHKKDFFFFFMFLLVSFMFLLKFLFMFQNWEVFNQVISISPSFQNWEVFNQVISISPSFIFLLLFLISFCLILILFILKKKRNFFNLVSLI